EVVEEGAQIFHRYGVSYESSTRLARQAALAEKTPIGVNRVTGQHGVSVTMNPPPGVATSQATRAAIEKSFRLVPTPTAADPTHHTLILPNPVTRGVADLFNAIFGRTR